MRSCNTNRTKVKKTILNYKLIIKTYSNPSLYIHIVYKMKNMKIYKVQIVFKILCISYVLVYYDIPIHKIYLKETNNIKQYITCYGTNYEMI